jgi:hypothetical protein
MFYINDVTTPVANASVALQYQQYLRQFVAFRSSQQPHIDSHGAAEISLSAWSVYGKRSMFANITDRGFVAEDMPRYREATCQFLNRVVADPTNGA